MRSTISPGVREECLPSLLGLAAGEGPARGLVFTDCQPAGAAGLPGLAGGGSWKGRGMGCSGMSKLMGAVMLCAAGVGGRRSVGGGGGCGQGSGGSGEAPAAPHLRLLVCSMSIPFNTGAFGVVEDDNLSQTQPKGALTCCLTFCT